MRRIAAAALLVTMAAILGAGWIAPHPYDRQFRDAPDAGVSRHFPLGTDALGRDRLSRMLYGARTSLVLAPAASLISCGCALLLGLAGGCLGRRAERAVSAAADLCLSLPWLFALLAVRAVLPLNAPAAASAAATFGLLGLLGWAGPCRILAAAARRHMQSDFVLLARAGGTRTWRIAVAHVIPNLLPLAGAQFLITVPAFLLAEANLGLLGLGIPEPAPSWGGMLRELENLPGAAAHPWVCAPALLLILTITLFQLVASADTYSV